LDWNVDIKPKFEIYPQLLKYGENSTVAVPVRVRKKTKRKKHETRKKQRKQNKPKRKK